MGSPDPLVFVTATQDLIPRACDSRIYFCVLQRLGDEGMANSPAVAQDYDLQERSPPRCHCRTPPPPPDRARSVTVSHYNEKRDPEIHTERVRRTGLSDRRLSASGSALSARSRDSSQSRETLPERGTRRYFSSSVSDRPLPPLPRGFNYISACNEMAMRVGS